MNVCLIILSVVNIFLFIFNLIMFMAAYVEMRSKDPTDIPEGKIRVFMPDGSEFEVSSYEFGVELAKILTKGDL